MEFLTAACTDIGNRKEINQDSLNVMIAETIIGKVAMIVVCDGIGGLSKGEVASAKAIVVFKNWFTQILPSMIKEKLSAQVIEREWKQLISNINDDIVNYANKYNVKLGTTLTAALFAQNKYYIVHVGDCRAYEINKELIQITKDQTVTAREVELGNMTLEEAKKDGRRHVLLQCIGASNNIQPEFFYGDVSEDASYLMCTDGFYNMLENNEIIQKCNKEVNISKEIMEANLKKLISCIKSRGENDNISAVLIQT